MKVTFVSMFYSSGHIIKGMWGGGG